MQKQIGGNVVSVYKKGVVITAMLSVLSLFVAILLNYCLGEQFWCNVCLGVYGSSLLTFITSYIGYFAERKSCMEGFYTETLKILNQYNKYQNDLTIDDKIDFFLFMMDYDRSSWNVYFRKMDFFKNEKRNYVYKHIYTPLKEIDRAILKYAWQFRMHKNGTGRNEAAMVDFVKEIEAYILDIKQQSIPRENNEEFIVSSSRNKIVEDILKELNGNYYVVMYGKKKAKQTEV